MTKREKILYLECYSGISGDMTVAALLDLGASETFLKDMLNRLPLDGYSIEIGRSKKCGIGACDFEVNIQEKQQEGHSHVHEKAHEHRSYGDICRMLDAAGLPEKVHLIAKKIFEVVAQAEAKVHETTAEEVHFHEVGAVDSIVDIVGTAACIADLGIEEIVVSDLREGTGTTWCQHGQIPVPAPAVMEILAEYRLPVSIIPVTGEMITPTGAAIAAALQTRKKLPETFTINQIGIGAGKKDFPHANILRALLIEACEREKDSQKTGKEKVVWVLETNIDDCSAEQLGYTMECLMDAGAKDVCFLPIYMKKNRPAYMLKVLCDGEKTAELEEVIFRETTSIGLRRYQAERTVLPREIKQVSTPYGSAQVKVCQFQEKIYFYPEYESVKNLCRRSQMPYQMMYEEIQRAAIEECKK